MRGVGCQAACQDWLLLLLLLHGVLQACVQLPVVLRPPTVPARLWW
jgi:hypothetical protein